MLMKFFLKKSFLLFIFPIFTIAEKSDSVKVQSLDKETQETICMASTSSFEAEDICLTDSSLSIERLTVCALYTSSQVAETLCLKNRLLSSADILKCFIDTPELIEQTCLVKSMSSDRITSHYFETNGDILPNIIKEIEDIEIEMTILIGYRVKFDITQSLFNFSTPNPAEEEKLSL